MTRLSRERREELARLAAQINRDRFWHQPDGIDLEPFLDAVPHLLAALTAAEQRAEQAERELAELKEMLSPAPAAQPQKVSE